MNIFISNLNYDVTEEQLHELCAECGEVVSVKIIIDHLNSSKGFAFVQMCDKATGELLISKLNDYEFHGKSLRIAEARPKEEGSDLSNRGSKRREPHQKKS